MMRLHSLPPIEQAEKPSALSSMGRNGQDVCGTHDSREQQV